MEKVKVSTRTTQNSVQFSINGKIVGSIYADLSNKGKYGYRISVYGVGNNMSYPEAVEGASDVIERTLKEWGLECEFVEER